MQDDQPNGNPWIRSLLIWGGVFLAIALAVSLFGGQKELSASQIPYSEFRGKVAEGSVADAQVGEQRITGHFKNGDAYSTIPIPNDISLPQLLQTNGVKYAGKAAEEPNVLLYILVQALPFVLILGVAFFALRQVQKGGGAGGAMGFGKSKAKLLTEKQGRVTFNDVAGIDEAREELEEIVEFLRDPGRFAKLGGQIPKGALLVGSPGTGKTLLARAIAGEAGVPFFTISGSDFVEMFVGVGASRVRDMFEQAKKNAPCIVFIDEIDAVGRHRGHGLGNSNDEREQTLNQLLVEMDGFEANEGIIIIAATNRPDVLDPALLRPGRFDRQVVVPIPDIEGREKILAVHMKKVPLAPDVVARVIARGTPGFSGADLANLVNEAALLAARRNKRLVAMQEFEDAKDKVMMGAERRSMVMTDDEKKMTAYHEAGHALVSMHEPASDPIHKATIIPRNMVTKWGMSDKLGPLQYEDQQEGYLGMGGSSRAMVSDQTAKLIDSEIRKLIDTAHERAIDILKKQEDTLHVLANALLEYETLSGDDIKELMDSGKLNRPDAPTGPIRPAALQGSTVPRSGKRVGGDVSALGV